MKAICSDLRIDLKEREAEDWTNISDLVESFELVGVLGDLWRVKLTILKSHDTLIYGVGDHYNTKVRSLREARADYALIRDVKVQENLEAYSTNARVGQFDTITLHLQADRRILRVNGGFPWEIR